MDPSNPYGEIPLSGNKGTPAQQKKIFKIIGIVVILIVAAIVIAVLFTEAAKRETERLALSEATRISRDGYKNTAKNIGDPAALGQRESGTPVQYNNASVIDACHLMPLASLREQALYVTASTTPDAISRYFFDGSTTRSDSYLKTANPLERDVNSCSFTLSDAKSRHGSLRLEIFQSNYSNDAALRRVLDDYLSQGAINEGVQKYDRVRIPIADGRTYHFLEKNQTFVGVELDLGSDKEVTIDAILRKVAERLASSLTSPRGPVSFVAESPTFDAPYINACSISAASDVASLFKKPASAIVHERLATATEIVGETGNQSNAVRHQCTRRTAGNPDTAASLTIEARSFENDGAAQRAMSELVSESVKPTARKVGDESVFSTDTDNKFIFRAGRAVVACWLYSPQGESKPQTLEKQQAMLLPVAEALHARLLGKPLPQQSDARDSGQQTRNNANET